MGLMQTIGKTFGNLLKKAKEVATQATPPAQPTAPGAVTPLNSSIAKRKPGFAQRPKATKQPKENLNKPRNRLIKLPNIDRDGNLIPETPEPQVPTPRDSGIPKRDLSKARANAKSEVQKTLDELDELRDSLEQESGGAVKGGGERSKDLSGRAPAKGAFPDNVIQNDELKKAINLAGKKAHERNQEDMDSIGQFVKSDAPEAKAYRKFMEAYENGTNIINGSSFSTSTVKNGRRKIVQHSVDASRSYRMATWGTFVNVMQSGITFQIPMDNTVVEGNIVQALNSSLTIHNIWDEIPFDTNTYDEPNYHGVVRVRRGL